MFDIWGGMLLALGTKAAAACAWTLAIGLSRRSASTRAGSFLLVHGDGELTFRMARSRSLRK